MPGAGDRFTDPIAKPGSVTTSIRNTRLYAQAMRHGATEPHPRLRAQVRALQGSIFCEPHPLGWRWGAGGGGGAIETFHSNYVVSGAWWVVVLVFRSMYGLNNLLGMREVTISSYIEQVSAAHRAAVE
jgi:hypothetical protein